jgi:hypothetical protein
MTPIWPAIHGYVWFVESWFSHGKPNPFEISPIDCNCIPK